MLDIGLKTHKFYACQVACDRHRMAPVGQVPAAPASQALRVCMGHSGVNAPPTLYYRKDEQTLDYRTALYFSDR